MKQILFITFALLLFNSIFAENPNGKDSTYRFKDCSYYEFSLGGSYLIDKDVDENLNYGFCANLRLRFDTKSRRFSVIPLFGIKSYSCDLQGSPDVSNVFTVVKLGLQLNYPMAESKNRNFEFSTFMNVNYAWLTNNWTWESQQSYYGSGTGSNSETFHVFKGNSFSIVIGPAIKYKFFFIELGYEVLDSKIRFSDEMKTELQNEGIEYDPDSKYKFNSFNFCAGVSISFSSFKAHAGRSLFWPFL